MYTFLCEFCSNAVLIYILLCFSARLCHKNFQPGFAFIWSISWFMLHCMNHLQDIEFILLVLFLFFYAILQVKADRKQAALISVLLLSVRSWATGFADTLGYWTARVIGADYTAILQYLDLLIVFFSCGLIYLFLRGISKLLYPKIQYLHLQMLVIAVCPFLFITLSEQVISHMVYGDTIVWAFHGGLVSPQVQTVPILLLQALAGMTFFSVLLLFRRLGNSIVIEEEKRFLLHQTAEQSAYIQEIQSREKQFSSLRHDMKNHLLLLQGLLNQHKIDEAHRYLSDLGALSNPMDYPVQTGNSTVDILLKSKFSAAAQKGVHGECSLKLPADTAITDLEWCIILGNAIDNAVHAAEAVAADTRYLHISGQQKGSFLYILVENPCVLSRDEITEGIGLSNIRAVVQKHSGTLDIDVTDGKFFLHILLVVSQQESGTSR